ncbi:MAG TPA: hypothetical protein VLN47_10425 [Clostridiaceae bacterium]|nr:hypothetical protein [Clostridiaceae bacterium]
MLRSLLRAITDFSFLFSFLSILFREEVDNGLLLVIFLVAITVSFAGTLLRHRSRLWPVVMILFVPLLLNAGSSEAATLILVSAIVSLLFIVNERGRLDYFYQIKEFHLIIRGMVLYLAVTILLSGFSILEDRVIQYVIVYVLNTSVLLRILRHDEYLAGNTRNRIYNMRLAAGSLFLSLVLSIESVREFLARAAGVSYTFLADVFFRIVYTPLFLIYTVVDAFFTFIFSRFTPPQTVAPETDTSGVAGMYRNYNEGFEIIGTSPYLRFLPGILLLLLISYVLYRLFKRKRAFSYTEGAYSEEREIIEKKGKTGLFSRRDRDSVRGRYARYLQSLKKETPIRPSDTSRDVLSKIQKELVDSASPGGVAAHEGENRSMAGESLDTHERIRNAYVKVRYGEEILTGEEEDAFKEAVDRVVKARETKAAGAKRNRKRHAR